MTNKTNNKNQNSNSSWHDFKNSGSIFDYFDYLQEKQKAKQYKNR